MRKQDIHTLYIETQKPEALSPILRPFSCRVSVLEPESMCNYQCRFDIIDVRKQLHIHSFFPYFFLTDNEEFGIVEMGQQQKGHRKRR